MRIFASTLGGFFASKLAATIQNFRHFLHQTSKGCINEKEKILFGQILGQNYDNSNHIHISMKGFNLDRSTFSNITSIMNSEQFKLLEKGGETL